MEFFINEILENDDIKQLLLSNPQYLPTARALAPHFLRDECPAVEEGILPVFVLSVLADETLKINTEKGIPHEITVATLKDVNIWLDNCRNDFGLQGLKSISWLRLHYTGRLFRLGRLQFILGKPLSGMPDADIAIDTHIPQGEPLRAKDCLQSFAMAKDFFKKYFPDQSPKYFMCESWLLSPALAEVLPEESNIVKFMRLWTNSPFPQDGKSTQAIERVFGRKYSLETLDSVPQNSSLQRALKQYLLSGKAVDAAAGYRPL